MWKGSVGGHDCAGSLLACPSTCGLRCGALSGRHGRDNGWEMASGDAGEAPGWAHRRWKRPFAFPILSGTHYGQPGPADGQSRAVGHCRF
jgi:hypothetical protein